MRRVQRLCAVFGMLVGAASLVAIGAAPAGAQEYPPGTCALSLSVSVAERGQTVLASTVNCTSPYESVVSVDLTLLSDPIFLTSTESNGAGQLRDVPFVVPQQAELGLHTVRSTGRGEDVPNLVLDAPLTVVDSGGDGGGGIQGQGGQPRPSGSGSLAFTGSDVLWLLLLALVLLTIGTALVLAARRRAEVQRRGAT